MNNTPHRPADGLAVFLAGLQAGMIGIGWMLAWLGLSAMGQPRGFWAAENLMASVFHGDAAIRRGFGFSTLSGIALYLLIYSLLGSYWLWFRALGRAAMPLVWLLHPENSTVFGHVIFGASIARFPAYLPKPDQPVAAPPGEEPPVPEAPAPEPPAEPAPTDRDLSGSGQVGHPPH